MPEQNYIQLVQLPDGTYAAMSRLMTWGDVAQLAIELAILILMVWVVWQNR